MKWSVTEVGTIQIEMTHEEYTNLIAAISGVLMGLSVFVGDEERKNGSSARVIAVENLDEFFEKLAKAERHYPTF